MQLLQRLPFVRVLHQRQLLFPVVITSVVAVVLAQGWWQQRAQGRREDVRPTPVETPSPRPRFANLEKAPLSYFSDYWSQLAARAGQSLAPIEPGSTTGILVEPNLALISLDAAPPFDGRVSAVTDTQSDASDVEMPPDADVTVDNAGYRLRGADIESGLALIEIDSADGAAFTLSDASTLTTGALVAAVWLDQEGNPRVMPGSFVAIRRPADDRARLVDLALGGSADDLVAIVDLDGNLIGVRPPGMSGAIAAADVPALVERMRAGGPCRAIVVADLSEPVAEALSVDAGVVVARVHERAFATVPGLRPGDVLVAWRDEPVASSSAFQVFYAESAPGSSVQYRFMRGRRRLTGTLVIPGRNCRPVASAPVHLVNVGMTVAPVSPSDERNEARWRIAAVDADGAAAGAGFEPGDVVMAINGTPLGDGRLDTLARRLEGGPRAVVVRVERRGDTTLLALPPRSPD